MNIDKKRNIDEHPIRLHYNQKENIWVLDSLQTLKLQQCNFCKTQLEETGWLVCQDHKMAFCENCELKSIQIDPRKKYCTGRLCPSRKDVHSHIPIGAARKEM